MPGFMPGIHGLFFQPAPGPAAAGHTKGAGWNSIDYAAPTRFRNRSQGAGGDVGCFAVVGQITFASNGRRPRLVKPCSQKYSAFQNILIILYRLPSRPTKGALRNVTTRGGMRWTRRVPLTRALEADGEVVWSWHPDAGVKFA